MTAPPARLFVEPQTLTILGTYKCTARCEHCCFGSNPFITQRLALPDILRFIDEGASYPSCKAVVFSGGECFLLRDDLVTAVAHATKLGLRTRCVTNGYWAKRLPHGRARLAQLVGAGLNELNISTGDFHQQWVPQEAVVNAACLAAELGLENTVIMVELQRERGVDAGALYADPRVRRLVDDGRLTLLESPWMPMDYQDRIEQPPHQMLNRATLHLRGGCTSILKTIVVTPERGLGYCCGLTREQIPELNTAWTGGSIDDLLDAGGRDFMKIWLHIDGPERILAWAATKEPAIEWEDRYAHHCHSCLALFRDPLVRETIRNHHRERVDDVLARYVTRLRAEQRDHAPSVPATS